MAKPHFPESAPKVRAAPGPSPRFLATRINLLLLVALVFSSIYLIRVSHESRRLFSELDRARNEERLLDSEYERLKSEKQSQATPLKVEKTARDKLAMRNATPAVTMYVTTARPPSAAVANLAMGPSR